MVSPRWYLLRRDLILLHQEERRSIGQADDPKLALVAAANTHALSTALHAKPDGDPGAVLWGHFTDRFVLELVCIRADQRAMAPPPPSP